MLYTTLGVILIISLMMWRRPGITFGEFDIFLSKVFMPIWFAAYTVSIILTIYKIETFTLWWSILFFILNGLLLWFFIHYFRTADRIPLAGLMEHGGYKVWIIVFATAYAFIAVLGYAD